MMMQRAYLYFQRLPWNLLACEQYVMGIIQEVYILRAF